MACNDVEPVMSDASDDSWTILDDVVHENQHVVEASEEIDNEEATELRASIEVEDGVEVLPAQPEDSPALDE